MEHLGPAKNHPWILTTLGCPATPDPRNSSVKKFRAEESLGRELLGLSLQRWSGSPQELIDRNSSGQELRASKGGVVLGRPGSKKCPKQSQNSLQSLKTVYFETPETVSRLQKRDSFGIPGPEGPGDSCKGRAGLQQLELFCLE